MRAKKSLGQHFLKSERALLTIVKAGEIDKKDTVLEIGPGMGALTEKLLKTDARVIAVEKDDELFKLLTNKFQKEIRNRKLELIHGDILDFEIENSKLKIENYKLIANIPYNITGAILKKFLGADGSLDKVRDKQPEKIVLLVQKEVAQRIVDKQLGSSTSKLGKEGVLSISVKAYGIPRYIETVKAGSFVPAPRVDSAIITIESISKNFFRAFSEKDFFEIVRVGFRSKRKKLSSNLSVIFEKGKILETFKKLGLGDNLRAEDVDIKTWQKLAQNLLSIK